MSDKQKTKPQTAEIQICTVCAWRANCKKKFTIHQSSISKCPDFTRDAALPENGKHDQ